MPHDRLRARAPADARRCAAAGGAASVRGARRARRGARSRGAARSCGASRPTSSSALGGYASAPAVVAAAAAPRADRAARAERQARDDDARSSRRSRDRVCVSFPETDGRLPAGRAVLTGNPVRGVRRAPARPTRHRGAERPHASLIVRRQRRRAPPERGRARRCARRSPTSPGSRSSTRPGPPTRGGGARRATRGSASPPTCGRSSTTWGRVYAARRPGRLPRRRDDHRRARRRSATPAILVPYPVRGRRSPARQRRGAGRRRRRRAWFSIASCDRRAAGRGGARALADPDALAAMRQRRGSSRRPDAAARVLDVCRRLVAGAAA